jgi:hypothetical protein
MSYKMLIFEPKQYLFCHLCSFVMRHGNVIFRIVLNSMTPWPNDRFRDCGRGTQVRENVPQTGVQAFNSLKVHRSSFMACSELKWGSIVKYNHREPFFLVRPVILWLNGFFLNAEFPHPLISSLANQLISPKLLALSIVRYLCKPPGPCSKDHPLEKTPR